MAEFAYNNAKNASTNHTLFKLNCKYYPWVFYKKDLDLYSKSKTAKKLSSKLQNLTAICQQNFHHAQKLEKQAHNKEVKPQNYVPGNKVWLSNKYLKTKRNHKLEAKFFGPFWILHLIGKQAYKLKLLKKYRICDIFHVFLLE